MKKFNGTKGEWIFDDINWKIKGSGDIEGMTVIANVSPRMDYSRGKTTQGYNAKLIASAPELLEVVQLSLEAFERLNCAILANKCREVISKAI